MLSWRSSVLRKSSLVARLRGEREWLIRERRRVVNRGNSLTQKVRWEEGWLMAVHMIVRI